MTETVPHISVLMVPPHEAADYLEAAQWVGVGAEVVDPTTIEERDRLLGECAAGWARSEVAAGNLEDGPMSIEFGEVALDSFRRQYEGAGDSPPVFVRITADPPPRGYQQGAAILGLVSMIQDRQPPDDPRG